MTNNAAIQILMTFTKDEMLKFGEFLKTPFHNNNNKAVQLFDLLKEHHPYYKSAELSKENIFRKLMGNAKFRESYVRNLFSNLNILLEKFLKHNIVKEDFAHERLLIEELKNRDLYGQAEKKIKLFEKKIRKLKLKDQEYYVNMNFIYEMKSFLVVDKTLTDDFRSKQMASIIMQFMISLMENSFYLKIEEQRVKIKHSFGFLRHSLDYIQNHFNEFEDSPLMMIYYYLWLCFINDNDERHFLMAKKYFRKHFNSLTKIDMKNIYSVMQVYYIDRIDNGDATLNREFLDFLLEMIKLNVLSHKKTDFINLNLYRNIIILCMMNKEAGILGRFISRYKNFVSEESRDSINAYSNAHLNFLKGNFEKTLELCNKVDFSDLLYSTNDNLFFKNDIKTLTLKCLYELNHFENALSNIDAFKHYLAHSNLMKDSAKKKISVFLGYVNEFIRIKTKPDEYRIKILKKKIEESMVVVQKEWLLEKTGEL